MTRKIRTSPDMPWKVRFMIAAHSFVSDLAHRSNGTVNKRIMSLVDFKVSSSPKKPIKGVTTSDITVDSSRKLWFRLFTPSATTASLPVIFYFHGGGFAFLAANSKPYHDFCGKIAREFPAVVVSVNYRLAPEHRYPCQYEDGFDVLKFIDEKKFANFPTNADLKRCFVAGDSAGGNLAHHVAVKAGEYEFKEVDVVGLMAIQPFFGGQERTESETRLDGAPFLSIERTDWMWKTFLPDGSDRDHPVVNVFGPRSVDISGIKFPKTVIVVGGFDLLQDWQKRYYDGLKKCGKEVFLIEYPNGIHGFYGFPDLPESSLVIKDLKNFMSEALEK